MILFGWVELTVPNKIDLVVRRGWKKRTQQLAC
jgi:hypothetical protein